MPLTMSTINHLPPAIIPLLNQRPPRNVVLLRSTYPPLLVLPTTANPPKLPIMANPPKLPTTANPPTLSTTPHHLVLQPMAPLMPPLMPPVRRRLPQVAAFVLSQNKWRIPRIRRGAEAFRVPRSCPGVTSSLNRVSPTKARARLQTSGSTIGTSRRK